MRQVNRSELIYGIITVIRNWSPALLRDLGSGKTETRQRARVMAAAAIADKGLAQFEVLTERDLPSQMGESAFSRPLERMMGDDIGPPVYLDQEP